MTPRVPVTTRPADTMTGPPRQINIEARKGAPTAITLALSGSQPDEELAFVVPEWRFQNAQYPCSPPSAVHLTRPKNNPNDEAVYDVLVDALASYASFESRMAMVYARSPKTVTGLPLHPPMDVTTKLNKCTPVGEALGVEINDYWWTGIVQDFPGARPLSVPVASGFAYQTRWMWLLFNMEPNGYQIDIDFWVAAQVGELSPGITLATRDNRTEFVRLRGASPNVVKSLCSVLWSGFVDSQSLNNYVVVHCVSNRANPPVQHVTSVEIPGFKLPLWP